MSLILSVELVFPSLIKIYEEWLELGSEESMKIIFQSPRW